MPSLKRTLCWTAAPVLITASLGFAGAAVAAGGPGYGSSSSGTITHPNQSAGTPSETVPMSPECKSNPSSPKCTEEPRQSPGMGSDPAGTPGQGMGGNGSHSMGSAPGAATHGRGSTGNGSANMGSGTGNMGNDSGSAGSSSGNTDSGNMSGSQTRNHPSAGGTSQMQPAVPEATTPAVRNGAAGNRNEPPNNISK